MWGEIQLPRRLLRLHEPQTELRARLAEARRGGADAAEAQKECWDSCRRRIRKAVVDGGDLEASWAKC